MGSFMTRAANDSASQRARRGAHIWSASLSGTKRGPCGARNVQTPKDGASAMSRSSEALYGNDNIRIWGCQEKSLQFMMQRRTACTPADLKGVSVAEVFHRKWKWNAKCRRLRAANRVARRTVHGVYGHTAIYRVALSETSCKSRHPTVSVSYEQTSRHTKVDAEDGARVEPTC